MSSPSALGDLGFALAGTPAATSTSMFINQQTASDTGTIVASGRAIDLANPLKSTTGSYLDTTFNPSGKTPKTFRSIGISLPFELRFDASGRYVFLSIAHQTRSATSGAGSTWETVKTGTKAWRMGTSTQGIFFETVLSFCNAQAIKRYYKAVVTLSRKLTTSTSAQDTTTGSQQVCGRPSYLFGGADRFPAQD